ncbi:hypothetical protein Tco_1563242 [Tanacetum coccineum]
MSNNGMRDTCPECLEQAHTNLSPDMPNDPVVQSNKELALNEHPDRAAVESRELCCVGLQKKEAADVHAVNGSFFDFSELLLSLHSESKHSPQLPKAKRRLGLPDKRDFVVHPNKDEYQIFRDQAVILGI